MLRLLLLRHAQATPPFSDDHDRTLTPKGRADATRLGAYLHEENLLPDRAVASSAMRTTETGRLVLTALESPLTLQLEPKLYLAAAPALLDMLHQAPDSAKTMLVIGHNPGFHELALDLVGYGDRYAISHLRGKFPTCALAVLDFDVEHWAAVALHSARLDRFITATYFHEKDDD